MATIKSYTDLEQSRKLAEILPLESADMHWSKDFDGSWFVDLDAYASVKIPKYVVNVEEHVLPCWSLAALLNVLPYPILCKKSDNTWGVDLWVDNKFYCTYASDKIEACYEMIIKLHELNLL